VPLADAGLGWRWRVGASRLLAELALRSHVFLRERHLHADPVPPPGSTDDNITDRSWYFGRGKTSSSFYVGLGYRF
jgi:hypothetical protein